MSKQKSDKLTELISEFVDANYPKGKEDRGFVILILALFLQDIEKNKKWKITKKKGLLKK